MKKVLLWLLILIFAVGVLSAVFFNRRGEDATENQTDERVLPAASEREVGGFLYNFFVVQNASELDLIENFEQKKSSREIIEENNCAFVSSSSFYTIDNEPVGLVVADYETLGEYKQNSLFNGVFSINDFDTPRITTNVPGDRLRIAVQSGPILIENGSVQSLNIRNDKNSRRIVGFVTGKNEFGVMAVYSGDNKFSGPLLADLAELVYRAGEKDGLNIADAINFDGGSASTFKSDEVFMTEISPVGAFFCLQRE